METRHAMAMRAGPERLLWVDVLDKVLKECPEAPAVVQGHDVRSYRQLGVAVATVAAQLRASGVGAGLRLAIDLPRSAALYEMMLACLLEGVSFMALPRSLGQLERVSVAQRSGCAGIVSNEALLPEAGQAIDGIGHVWRLSEDDRAPSNEGPSAPEIYCVRTSGTTGEPKVVPIRSGQLTSFLESSHIALGVPEWATWSWMHDLSFDFSIWETLGCLVHRGCLIVVDEETKRNPAETLRLLVEAEVNVLSVTPSEFRYIFSCYDGRPIPDGWRLTDVIFCGEELTVGTLLPLFDELNRRGVRVMNTYGPSEATVFCSFHRVVDSDLDGEGIPIGRALPGTELELMSADDTGVGELVLRGFQVFEGYDGNEPLVGGYSTGDMCRIDDRGEFVYVGRSGGYQKINGFRVELYEIEQHLRSLPGVDEAVVWAENLEEQGEFLLAAVRARPAVGLSTRDLRRACSGLPHYMRPARYLLLQNMEWPVNDRGKTDRMLLRRKTRDQ